MIDSRETVLFCVRYALEKKAYDILVLDMREHSSLAEYFLICTGRSDTQVQAITRGVEEGLARVGTKPRAVEGFTRAHWVLMDYGDVVVHIFIEPVRRFYDLERLWSRAPRVPLPEPYRSQALSLQLAGGET